MGQYFIIQMRSKILQWISIQKFLPNNVQDYLIYMCLHTHISFNFNYMKYWALSFKIK